MPPVPPSPTQQSPPCCIPSRLREPKNFCTLTLQCKANKCQRKETHLNDTQMLRSSLQSKFSSRSMGVKLLIVCVLALVMTIPALFVNGLVDDRTRSASD